MKIAMVQQHAGPDKRDNVARGLRAFETAARAGAQVIGFAELAFEPFYPQTSGRTRVVARSGTGAGPDRRRVRGQGARVWRRRAS